MLQYNLHRIFLTKYHLKNMKHNLVIVRDKVKKKQKETKFKIDFFNLRQI